MSSGGRELIALFNPKKKLEKDIETEILFYLVVRRRFFAFKQPNSGFFDTSKGRFRKHTSPYVRRGVPDIFVIFKGRLICFEVKSPTGKQSPHQVEFEKEIRAAEGFYFVVRSVEDVMKALDEVMKQILGGEKR